MTRRVVACFESQSYPAKRLVIFDTSKASGEIVRYRGHLQHVVLGSTQTVGELRNAANAFADPEEIIIHFDSDDYSHPNRIAEQVALLQSSGADCVGYREMLFWRHGEPERYGEISDLEPARLGEAWLYSNRDPRYCLGTSLCYWRKTWERKPFQATNQGEDHLFTLGLKCIGISANPIDDDPLMIARIHAGNTSNAYDPLRKSAELKRVPEWDSRARSIMEGK